MCKPSGIYGLLLISYQALFEELPLDLNLPRVDAGSTPLGAGAGPAL